MSPGGRRGDKPPIPVRVETGTHPSVRPRPRKTEYAQHRPGRSEGPPEPERRSPTGEREKVQLRHQWAKLEEERKTLEDQRKTFEIKRQALAESWPHDVTMPGGIPTVDAIDWESQPPIPAEKIDWSAQGQPLRVKPTLGSMAAVITILVSLLGAGAYFYWGVKLHVQNHQLHLPADGVPWGVKASFETRKEATKARQKIKADIIETVKVENQKLKTDIIRAVKDTRRRPYRRRR